MQDKKTNETSGTVAMDYEKEYHCLIGEVANIHNEREDAKSAVLVLSAIVTEQRKKIDELTKHLEDQYWERRSR